MKKILLPFLSVLAFENTFAQQEIFAISGRTPQKIEFNDFRSLSADGTSASSIFGYQSESQVMSQQRKTAVAEDKNAYGNAQAAQMAALAYDASGKNLMYMPMFSSHIYVLNVISKKITLVENSAALVSPCDINSHITRMTAAKDGSVYALNNVGTQLLQIKNTNGEYTVKNLGTVENDASNGKNSFSVMETGFGGDMIADTENNLYVISGAGNIFKISTRNMKAVFVGKILGLPEQFTVNGGAVGADGKIIVGSAKGFSLFSFSLENLQATALPSRENLPVYDLASQFFLNDRKMAPKISSGIDLYPTKVDDGKITVQLNDPKIKSDIQLTIFDVTGRLALQKTLSVQSAYSKHEVVLSEIMAGTYLVMLSDESGRNIFSKKIIINR